MKNRIWLYLSIIVLTSAYVPTLFAQSIDIDTIYQCNFDNYEQNRSWRLKNSSSSNKWRIGKLSSWADSCLFVSKNANDTTYSNSQAVIIAQTLIPMTTDDSIDLTFTIRIKGETTRDYLKVFLLNKSQNLTPLNAATRPWYSQHNNATNAFRFPTGRYYFSNQINDTIITIRAKNPSPCDSALLAFVWVNDNSVSNPPAAIIDKILMTSSRTTIIDTICSNQSLIFNNTIINTSGIYYDTLITNNGCDSLIKHNVIVLPTFADTISTTICKGEQYRLNNGLNISTTGFYIDTLRAINGCDSIVYINLIVNDTFNVLLYDTICQGERYNNYGFDLTMAGIYEQRLQSTNQCDSIIRLNLYVRDSYDTIINARICTGETYNLNGFNDSISGIYFDTLTATNGCDSILQLRLTVYSSQSTNIVDTICDNQQYNSNGFSVTQPGEYVLNLQNQQGCDSIVTLNLAFLPTNILDDDLDTVIICQSDSYVFGSRNLTNAGNYFDTLQNIYGCDSILGLNLMVIPSSDTIIFDTIIDSNLYAFAGLSLSETGVYVDSLQNSFGCDSIVTLYLEHISNLENVNKSSLKLYPQPAKDLLQINFAFVNQPADIYVFNSNNQLLIKQTKPYNEDVLSLDITSLVEGQYSLIIKLDNQLLYKPLLIVR